MVQFADTNSSYTIGDIKVTFLPDGGGIMNPLAMYAASENIENWQPYAYLLDEEGKLRTTVGSFLIEAGDRKIAVDTGLGPMTIEFPGFGPFIGGEYMNSLKKAGVSREDVTDVLFTHLHLDHVGWTTIEVDGKREMMYPNARHLVTEVEWNFWYGGDDPLGPHPEAVQEPLKDRIEFIEGGDELAPNIKIISTPGHTPGHLSLLITSGDERLYLCADLLHSESQLYEPTWSVPFDVDPAEARATREAMYAELIKPNTVSAWNHFSNKIFGRLSKEDGGYKWSPL
jgi:glyoxylase-like metal-dependent hydrolase (beta-lactamase superfamily II)